MHRSCLLLCALLLSWPAAAAAATSSWYAFNILIIIYWDHRLNYFNVKRRRMDSWQSIGWFIFVKLVVVFPNVGKIKHHIYSYSTTSTAGRTRQMQAIKRNSDKWRIWKQSQRGIMCKAPWVFLVLKTGAPNSKKRISSHNNNNSSTGIVGPIHLVGAGPY